MKNKQELIASDLAQKIRSKMYSVGEFLPSENQLTELYGTSRETVRNALSLLTQLGLIQKIKGKGSIVLNSDRFSLPISGIVSFQELNEQLGLHASTKVISCEPISSIPQYFIEHGVDENTTGTYVERLRTIDQVPSVIDCDYLLPPVTGITKEIAEHSLYQYIEDTLKLNIAYANKEITVEPATEKIKEELQLDQPLVVVTRSMSFLQDTTLFQLTESYHRPEKFKFTDFARRNPIQF